MTSINHIIYYLINLLDKRLSLAIFPRDRIMSVTSDNLSDFRDKKFLIGPKDYGFDMYYYVSSFNYNGEDYICFQATRTAISGQDESHIVIIDSKKKPIFDLMAGDMHFDRFYSPQVLIQDKDIFLYFCAEEKNTTSLYRMNIGSLSPGKIEELKSNLGAQGEQFVYKFKDTYHVFHWNNKKRLIESYETRDFKRYISVGLKFKFRENYKFINNPSIIKKGNTYHLFCRLSQKNALESKIISFISKDLKSFVQTKFELRPTIDKHERHSTAYPSIAKIEKKYVLYYTGYWGRHLMEKKTLKNWGT